MGKKREFLMVIMASDIARGRVSTNDNDDGDGSDTKQKQNNGCARAF